MKSTGKKIGPGVYAVGPLGEIEYDEAALAQRRRAGLPTAPEPFHLTRETWRRVSSGWLSEPETPPDPDYVPSDYEYDPYYDSGPDWREVREMQDAAWELQDYMAEKADRWDTQHGR